MHAVHVVALFSIPPVSLVSVTHARDCARTSMCVCTCACVCVCVCQCAYASKLLMGTKMRTQSLILGVLISTVENTRTTCGAGASWTEKRWRLASATHAWVKMPRTWGTCLMLRRSGISPKIPSVARNLGYLLGCAGRGSAICSRRNASSSLIRRASLEPQAPPTFPSRAPRCAGPPCVAGRTVMVKNRG